MTSRGRQTHLKAYFPLPASPPVLKRLLYSCETRVTAGEQKRDNNAEPQMAVVAAMLWHPSRPARGWGVGLGPLPALQQRSGDALWLCAHRAGAHPSSGRTTATFPQMDAK